MNTNEFKKLCFLAGLFLCLAISCTKQTPLPIAPDEFTKSQREDLGALLQNTIALDQAHFQILPKSPPNDTSVYWLVQKLYDQATNVMRIDHQAASDNHWTKNRPWPVHILVSDEKNAFILPGGYFYITTGLLKSLSKEYELYYILSFEANLMNDGILLERLVSEVNSNDLADLVSRNSSPGGVKSKALAQTLSSLEFDPEEVLKTDKLTVNSICNTSQWDRTGLLSIIEANDDNLEWLNYRPSYSNRKEKILNIDLDSPEDCGSLRTNNATNEGYKRFVLDRLQ